MTATQGMQESSYVLYAGNFRWPSGVVELTYSFNDYVFSGSDSAREARLGSHLSEYYRDIVREAMDTWERVSGVRFREVADAPGNDIRIGWGQDSDGPYGTLGTEWRWWSSGSFGRTVKSAIVFDTAESWDRTTFYDTALHEIGHAIGIDHSNVRGVVMSGPPYTEYFNQPGRDVLQPDDIAAARALWGTSPPGRTIIGTADADTLTGGNGNDTIRGDFGDDSITGGEGDDVLAGNGVYWTHWNNPQGNYWSRTYDGSYDRDYINGGPGNDFINGNAGVDWLEGGPGNDTILGGQNEGTWEPGKTRTNTIHLRQGFEALWGDEGDDFLNGNMGTDYVDGGTGHDLLRGGQDRDVLSGDDGDDTLYGDLEDDDLYGGAGNDVLVLGNDPNYGDGALDAVYLYTTEAGRDTVYGFEMNLDRVYIDDTRSTAAEAERLGLAVFEYIV